MRRIIDKEFRKYGKKDYVMSKEYFDIMNYSQNPSLKGRTNEYPKRMKDINNAYFSKKYR